MEPAPPMVPGFGVSGRVPPLSDRVGNAEVSADSPIAIVLKVAPVNACPSGANGIELSRLMLPMKDAPITSGTSSEIQREICLYGSRVRLTGLPTTMPFSSLSVRVIVFAAACGLAMATPRLRLMLGRNSTTADALVVRGVARIVPFDSTLPTYRNQP